MFPFQQQESQQKYGQMQWNRIEWVVKVMILKMKLKREEESVDKFSRCYGVKYMLFESVLHTTYINRCVTTIRDGQ